MQLFNLIYSEKKGAQFLDFTSFVLKKSLYGDYQLVLFNDNLPGALKRKKDLFNFDDRDYLGEADARAKRTVFDYSLNNSFDYFVTFTFDPKKIDSLELENCRKKFLKAINNYNTKFGVKLSYIAIPELTKSKRLHFHCLMSGLKDLKFLSTDKKTGHKIFVSQFFKKNYGANRVLKIFDYNKFVVVYITKYMTKDGERLFKRRYFVSKSLDKSQCILKGDASQLNHLNLNDLIFTYQTGLVTTFKFTDLEYINKLFMGGDMMAKVNYSYVFNFDLRKFVIRYGLTDTLIRVNSEETAKKIVNDLNTDLIEV